MNIYSLRTAIVIKYVFISTILHFLLRVLLSLMFGVLPNIIILILACIIPFFSCKIAMEFSIGKKIIIEDDIDKVRKNFKGYLQGWNIATFILWLLNMELDGIFFSIPYIINCIIVNFMLKKKIDRCFETNNFNQIDIKEDIVEEIQ